jgi:hypothetical protein
MEKNDNDLTPVSTVDNYDYKYPSCDFPSTLVFNSEESKKQALFNTFSKKRKRVTFTDNVTIINIPSHKKKIRKQNNNNLKEKIEQDFKEEEDRKKACVNCIVF